MMVGYKKYIQKEILNTYKEVSKKRITHLPVVQCVVMTKEKLYCVFRVMTAINPS